MSWIDRAVVAAGAAVVGVVDPSRGDMIALLGELTAGAALPSIRDRMAATEEGRGILRDRPRIRVDRIDMEALAQLPAGTFGREYAQYLSRHGFSPDERHEVQFVADPELAYVMQRYREVHDFWHVLSGLPPTVVGEVAVKWLEMVQTGLPMCALSAFVAPARLSPADRRLLCSTYIPWAINTGKTAAFLLGVRYEDLLPLPLDEVRKRLHFAAAPHPPAAPPSRGSGAAADAAAASGASLAGGHMR